MVDSGRRSASGILEFPDEQASLWTGGGRSDDGRLTYGFSSSMGRRSSMEDYFDIRIEEIDSQAVYLFGIFDGHGGKNAAEYLKSHLLLNLLKHPDFLSNTTLAIRETYIQTDEDFLNDESNRQRDDGSTALTAVMVGNNLYLANVGDSRAIISKAGQVIQVSDDHKPNRTDERLRIENAGGFIMWAGTWRVGGVLAMSRAFGNRLLKQFIVAEPEILEEEVDKELEYLILATDGLWDVVKNEDALEIVKSEDDPVSAARKLAETALNRESSDNVTCIVVKFNHDNATAAGSSVDSPSAHLPSSKETSVETVDSDPGSSSAISVDSYSSPPASDTSSTGSADTSPSGPSLPASEAASPSPASEAGVCLQAPPPSPGREAGSL